MCFSTKYLKIFEPYMYFIFRVFVGFFFFMHGAQKLFGIFGGNQPVELISLFGLAGLIEFAAGLAMTIGLFTRLSAFVSAIQMAVAYFMAHATQGLNPISNKGELALLYFASFLILMIYGAKKFSLERLILKKEIF